MSLLMSLISFLTALSMLGGTVMSGMKFRPKQRISMAESDRVVVVWLTRILFLSNVLSCLFDLKILGMYLLDVSLTKFRYGTVRKN